MRNGPQKLARAVRDLVVDIPWKHHVKGDAYGRTRAEGESRNLPAALPDHLAEQARGGRSRAGYNLTGRIHPIRVAALHRGRLAQGGHRAVGGG